MNKEVKQLPTDEEIRNHLKGAYLYREKHVFSGLEGEIDAAIWMRSIAQPLIDEAYRRGKEDFIKDIISNSSIQSFENPDEEFWRSMPSEFKGVIYYHGKEPYIYAIRTPVANFALLTTDFEYAKKHIDEEIIVERVKEAYMCVRIKHNTLKEKGVKE